ncbi:MAG TPA: hypothetical protein VN380_13660 [Thermoanaerobaculia bacterium]|jgi:hypothetical protein|nr:hypothetical protein [Thermoanaerobaculia bacterium]
MTEDPSIEPAPAAALEETPVEVSVPPEESRQPRKSSLAITRLIQALWLGSGVFLMLSASAAFSAATNPTDAANVVGAILTRWHYIALLAPLFLLFLEWRRSRTVMLVILFVAILLASFQALLDTRIRIIRAESFAPISSLPSDDPVRRQFGMLHGISQLFLLGQVIAAATAIAIRE